MTERVDVKTGYYCNNWCRFCVQAHNRKYGNRTTQEIKDSLAEAKKEGVTGVVFTGGEFTIRKDALTLIKYARSIGYTQVMLQSNGRMFCNRDYVEKLISAGANQFSPAIHGSCPDVHDFLTRAPGAWHQAVSGIKLLRRLNQRVITNCVIVKANMRDLPRIAKLLVSLDVEQFQFAFVHIMGNALENKESIVPIVSMASVYIKKGLLIGIKGRKKVMAEAMPYCLMQGYERYVTELYIPDTMVREKDMWIKDFEKVRRTQGKMLFSQCKDCRFRLICEGPWREYPEMMGEDEFRPVPGKVVESKREVLDNYDEFPVIPKK
ncbi:MAG TPA: radical SAM protein [Candidatus Woesearchaeota archaeon]|nr:radical SAM protein [Candidatus Woesearchaeota archaeon]